MSKRQDLSSKLKCEFRKSHDVLPKISLRDAATRLNVSRRTLNTFFAFFLIFLFFSIIKIKPIAY
jgi:hypothetical protein